MEIIPAKLKKASKFDPQMNNTTLDIFEQVVTSQILKEWDNKDDKTHKNLSKN